MRRILLFTAFALLACTGAYAQVTTSSLSGVVQDTKGETLPGATVMAVHTPSGTQYGSATNAEGRFNIPNMRVGGPYTIEIVYVGYQTTKITDVYLKLGEPMVLSDIKLTESSTELQEVIVTSSSMGEITGASTGISNRQLNSLPTISRSITDFTRLTPQSNGNSFAGRDGRYNNLQIDGANFNNAFGLSDNVLPGGRSQPISLDAIEEIQVNIAPYDVRQGGFTGAGINAVTRSGTNTFTGSAYTFFRNQNNYGRKINDLELDELDESTNRIYGFRLGGPIIKNKLFFFVNAERSEDTGAGAGATNLWKASENGVADPNNNIARTRRTDLEAVRDHLIDVWGYNPGRYEGYANDAEATSTSFMARLDWNINNKHRLAIRYNQVVGASASLPNGNSGPGPRSGVNRVSAESMAFEKSMYDTENSVRSVTLELNSTFTDRLSNQFLATYSRIQDVRKSPSEIFPMVDIGDGTGTTTSYTNYMSFGYELFTFNNDMINDNYSFTNNLTYLAGKHTFTAGASFDVQKFGNNYVRMGTSYYRYATVADFLTTGTPGEVAPLTFGLTYPYEGMDPYARTNFGNVGLYIQDRYEISSKFNVTVGVRAELPIYMNELTPNEAVDNLTLLDIDGNERNYSTGNWPKTRLMVSPRIGFRYDPRENGSLVLRGGTGIFTGRVPFVWLSNMPTNSGVLQNTIEPTSYAQAAPWIGDIRFNPDPYYWLDNTPASAQSVFIKSPSGGLPSTVSLVDDDFRMLSVWRTSLGVDYKIPGTPLIATADVIYTRDINAATQFGTNRKEATAQITGAGGDTRSYWANAAAAQYNPALSANNAVALTNTSEKGDSFSGTVGVTLPSTKGFFGSLFYTYSFANEVTGNPGSNAASAWSGTGNASINSPNDQILMPSSYAIPNRVVASIAYRVEYLKHLATTVSLYYNGANAGRYSYTYNGSITGAGGFTGGLIYVPTDSEIDEELTFTNVTSNGVTFTVDEQREALKDFIANDKYLSERRGDYAERNGALLPWVNRFDFRLLQDLFTNIGKRRHTLQLSVDIFNVGNLLSSKWGVRQELNGANQLMNVTNTTGTPSFQMRPIQVDGETILPTTPFRDVTTTSTTWSMQFGLRYIF